MRRFRIEQAERLLPAIEAELRLAVQLKATFDDSRRRLQAIAQRVALLGGSQLDPEQVLKERNRQQALASRLHELVQEIEQYGCLVKDLDVGLVDFPTVYRGQEVYLCWRLGEPRIQYWHGVEEGFRGRKPIDEDFLRNHEGDPSV